LCSGSFWRFPSDHLLVDRFFFLIGCVEECRLKESVRECQFAVIDKRYQHTVGVPLRWVVSPLVQSTDMLTNLALGLERLERLVGLKLGSAR
jgi:hypothetical protein